MTATANADLSAWIGKTETVTDSVTATPYAALSATLDRAPEAPEVFPGSAPRRFTEGLVIGPAAARRGFQSPAQAPRGAVQTGPKPAGKSGPAAGAARLDQNPGARARRGPAGVALQPEFADLGVPNGSGGLEYPPQLAAQALGRGTNAPERLQMPQKAP